MQSGIGDDVKMSKQYLILKSQYNPSPDQLLQCGVWTDEAYLHTDYSALDSILHVLVSVWQYSLPTVLYIADLPPERPISIAGNFNITAVEGIYCYPAPPFSKIMADPALVHFIAQSQPLVDMLLSKNLAIPHFNKLTN